MFLGKTFPGGFVLIVVFLGLLVVHKDTYPKESLKNVSEGFRKYKTEMEIPVGWDHVRGGWGGVELTQIKNPFVWGANSWLYCIGSVMVGFVENHGTQIQLDFEVFIPQ